MKIIVPIIAAVVFVLAIIAVPKLLHKNDSAQAADITYTWTGAGDGSSWSDNGNWDVGGSYPDDATDIAKINATAGAITTPAGGALTIKDLEISLGFTGTVTLGNDLTLTNISITAGRLIDNGKTVNVGGNITIDPVGTVSTISSTGSWIQTANGNIDFYGWAYINLLFNSYQVNAGVTATITQNLVCKKLILQTDAVLASDTASHYAVVRDISGDDAIDIASGANVTSSNLYLYPRYQTSPAARETFNQKAIGISSGLSVGFGKNVTVAMTGDWSLGRLQVLGGPASTSEETSSILDTSGHNLTISGNLYYGTPIGNGSNYKGKILFRTGTHRVSSNLIRFDNAISQSFLDFGSSSIHIGDKVNLSNADIVGTDTSVITLSGTVKQQVTCDGETLHHLTVTNHSAGGIEFTDGCNFGTLTNISGGSHMVFKAGANYNISSLSLAGEDDNNISLGSSATGSQWFFNVLGSPKVSYLSVSDSNASGGSRIDASNCTNEDHGNNSNWDFGSCNQTTTTTTPGETTENEVQIKNALIGESVAITAPASFATINSQYLPEMVVPGTIPAHGAVKIPITYDPSMSVIAIIVDGKIYDLVPISELATNDNMYYLGGLQPGNHTLQYYGIDNQNQHTPLSITQNFFVSRAEVGIFGFAFSLWWLALVIPVFLVALVVLAWRKHKHLDDFRARVEGFRG